MSNGEMVVMNKPVYLGQAILDFSKLVMYEFNYDYMREKYPDNLKLCYMDADSLVYHIKTQDFYADIAAEVPVRFDPSAHRSDRPLPIGLNNKVIGLMKDEMGGEIIEELYQYNLYYILIGNQEVLKAKNAKE